MSKQFIVDEVNSDDETFYVDIVGKGTVVISSDDKAVEVAIYKGGGVGDMKDAPGPIFREHVMNSDFDEKVSVMDLDHIQFREKLAESTTPMIIYYNAPNIYDFMSDMFQEDCMDSVLREWAFQWYCEQTGDDYNNIYNRWLDMDEEKEKRFDLVFRFRQLMQEEGEPFLSSGDNDQDYETITQTIKAQGFWAGTKYKYFFDEDYKLLTVEERKFGA